MAEGTDNDELDVDTIWPLPEGAGNKIAVRMDRLAQSAMKNEGRVPSPALLDLWDALAIIA